MVIVSTFESSVSTNLRIDYVLHVTMPSSLNAYVQETGKAGRHGNQTECVLFYSILDYQSTLDFITEPFKKQIKRVNFKQQKNLESELSERRDELYSVLVYSENLTVCRQVFLLKYFNEETATVPCGVCDVCMLLQDSFVVDVSFVMKKILMAIWTINRHQKTRKEATYASINNFTALLKGNHHSCTMGSWIIREWAFGSFKSWDDQFLYRLLVILLSNKLVKLNQVADEKFNINQNLIITPKGQAFLQTNEEVSNFMFMI